jgi:hypothetical protein
MKGVILELRDRATFIPVLALRLEPESEEQRFLICRAGFPEVPEDRSIALFNLNCGSRVEYDPFAWGDRTFHFSHLHIIENFDSLKDGD